jgi:hypothetical protein
VDTETEVAMSIDRLISFNKKRKGRIRIDSGEFLGRNKEGRN